MQMRNLKSWLGLAALVSLLVWVAPVSASDIKVEGPWARASIGIERPGVVYMTIRNHGNQSDRLLAVTTPLANHAMLHESVREREMMIMRAVESIDILPGETVMLAPSGLHVMLISLHKKLIEGENFPLTLHFLQAGKITVDVNVSDIAAQKAPAVSHDHHEQHHHE